MINLIQPLCVCVCVCLCKVDRAHYGVTFFKGVLYLPTWDE